MANDIIERAKRILDANRYMILATSHEEKPWSTPVFYAHDENYNFYWYSRKDTRHSVTIKDNKSVSASIFGVGNKDEGFGVYAEVSRDELEEALATYMYKAATNDKERIQLTTKEDFLGDSP